MVVNIAVDGLVEIGLSENEAKAYVGLLSLQPATAYEIAKSAGIPTSKIYQVLEKLMAREVVLPSGEGEKRRYVAINPKEFLDSRKQRYDTVCDGLVTQLSEIRAPETASFIWNLQSNQGFLERARGMIDSAKDQLLLSIWAEEAAALASPLLAAEKRGVAVAVVHFGPSSMQVGQVDDLPISDTIYEEKGGRGFTLVCDRSFAMIATLGVGSSVDGAWSRNAGFVNLAEDYVKHDIYIMKIVKRYEDELTRRFGRNYERLRDVFADTEES